MSKNATGCLLVEVAHAFGQVDPIFLPAAEMLADNEDLLTALYQTKATLINSLNTGEAQIQRQCSQILRGQRFSHLGFLGQRLRLGKQEGVHYWMVLFGITSLAKSTDRLSFTQLLSGLHSSARFLIE